MTPILADILAGRVIDRRSGLPFICGIEQIWIERDLAGRESELLQTMELGRRVMLLADSYSYQVIGERVERNIKQTFDLESCIIDGHARPDDVTLKKLEPAFAAADAILAIGSGTINDLAKFGSYQHDKPYVIFASAPSMNGYTSKNASIIMQGHKKTLPARPPKAILVDLMVLAKAPWRSVIAGLGDSLARSTAQVDWLLSHLLLGSFYLHQPFDWLLPLEEELFGSVEALKKGDLDAYKLLIENLFLSGLGMNFAGGSYPASQAEHLIAHYMDMHGMSEETYHGEHIALTAQAMSWVHEQLLAGPPPLLRSDETQEVRLAEIFGADTGKECWAEFRQKKDKLRAIEQLNEKIQREWRGIVEILHSYHRPYDQMVRLARQMQAPLRAKDLDWPLDLYRRSFHEARYLRDRFTALDLGGLAGNIDEWIAPLLK